METAITLKVGKIGLEGRWSAKSITHAAIITHPHPLYGGDMDNSVVQQVAAAYAGLGWSTLRFNFRGTGNSEGVFDNGEGEQLDIQAAVDFLRAGSYRYIDLGGYSFGSWVLARWAARHTEHLFRLILVAPPVAFIDFSKIGTIPGLHQVISGDQDDLAPPRQIESMLGNWNRLARLAVIQGADHSYWGFMDQLKQIMVTAIQRRSIKEDQALQNPMA